MELDTRAKIDLWRQKIIEGTITDEELIQAVNIIRADRVAAAEIGMKRRAAKGPAKSGEDLINELENL